MLQTRSWNLWDILVHPPYRPGVVSSDYHLFPALKKTPRRDALRERRGIHGSGEQVSPGVGRRVVRRGDKEARGATQNVHQTKRRLHRKIKKASGFLRM